MILTPLEVRSTFDHSFNTGNIVSLYVPAHNSHFVVVSVCFVSSTFVFKNLSVTLLLGFVIVQNKVGNLTGGH